MKRKGKGSVPVVGLLIAMPMLTLLLSLLGAKLILSEVLPEQGTQWIAALVTGITALLLSFLCAKATTQKKFLWGMGTAGTYCCMLLLGNLLFFGVGYGSILGVAAFVFGGGVLGSLLGAIKRRKFA